MKSTDLRAKARAIFGPANPEPMPNQPNGAAALQKRANARPIPTYKVGGVVKKADGGMMKPKLSTAERKMGDALMMTRKGKEVMAAQKAMEAEKEMQRRKKQEAADRLLGIPKKKDGGKLSEFEKAFAGARKEGKKTFDYSGKSYTTEMRSEPKEAKKTGFGDAFASARRAGKETFEYNGKTYGTKMANEAVSDKTRRAVSKMPIAPAAGSRDNPFKAKSSEDITVTGVKRPTVKERFQSGKLFKAKDGGKASKYAEGGKPLKFEPKKEKPFKFEPKPEKPFKFEPKPEKPFKFEPKPEKPFKFTGKKDGGKVQTSADTARKLATEMGGMKKGGKAKDGLAVMIAIGKVKKPVKKAVGGAGKTRKGMAPIKKAQGGAAKVRKGMMSETGDIKQVVKPKKGLGGM